MMEDKDFNLSELWETFKLINKDKDILAIENFEDGLKEFMIIIKEELFRDPEPCCHGVREKEAKGIIDKYAGDGLNGSKK